MPANTSDIALFGLFGVPNLGNNATLAAMLEHVRRRRPDARMLCVVPQGSTVTAEYELPSVAIDPLRVSPYLWRIRPQALWEYTWCGLQVVTEPFRARRARQALAGVRHLLIPGTGVIDDFGQGPLNLPLDVWRWARAARAVGARVDYVSIGVEAIAGPVERCLFGAALRQATGVTYRDVESMGHARELGIAARDDSVYPDLAFSLPRHLLPKERPVNWPPRIVGVGVMGYRGWNAPAREAGRIYDRYLDDIKHLISALLERGLSVRLLTGDTRADAAPIQDLRGAFGTQIAVRDGARVFCDEIGSVADLLPQLAATDLVIATRFHNVLLSLLLERPAISLGYSTKNDSLMRTVGMGDFCHHIEKLDVSAVMRQVVDLSNMDIAPRIERIRRMNRASAERLNSLYDRLLPSSELDRAGADELPQTE